MYCLASTFNGIKLLWWPRRPFCSVYVLQVFKQSNWVAKKRRKTEKREKERSPGGFEPGSYVHWTCQSPAAIYRNWETRSFWFFFMRIYTHDLHTCRDSHSITLPRFCPSPRPWAGKELHREDGKWCRKLDAGRFTAREHWPLDCWGVLIEDEEKSEMTDDWTCMYFRKHLSCTVLL